MRIWKYPLDSTPGTTAVEMPVGARILSVGTDRLAEKVAVWALVDASRPLETRRLEVVWTGTAIGDSSTYLGTTTIAHSLFHADIVCHVFEVNE